MIFFFALLSVAQLDKTFEGEFSVKQAVPPQACRVVIVPTKDVQSEKKGEDGKTTIKATKGFGCSATLVNRNYVLTAGHCIETMLENVPFIAEVRCNEDKIVRTIAEMPQVCAGKEVTISPPRLTQCSLDFGLLKLNEPIDDPKPARLPESRKQAEKLIDDGNCLLWGFGKKVTANDFSPRWLPVLFLADEYVRALPGVGALPEKGLLRWGVDDGQFTNGDSGASLICKDTEGTPFVLAVASATKRMKFTLDPSLKGKLTWKDGSRMDDAKLQMFALANVLPGGEWLKKQLDSSAKCLRANLKILLTALQRSSEKNNHPVRNKKLPAPSPLVNVETFNP